MLTWDELMAKGQILIRHTPGNVTKNMHCKICESNYCSTKDYNGHITAPKHQEALKHPPNKSKGQLTPTDLNKLPWKKFKRGNGEWIFSNQAPHLLEAINYGTTTFGNYIYWTYEGDRGTIFIARRKTV